MPNSIRQQVIDAVSDKLRQISKANGYSRDIGDRVVDHLILTPTAPTPCVALYDQMEDVKPVSLNYRSGRKLTLGVVFVDSYMGDDPSAYTRTFLAEIQKAMGSEFTLTVVRQGTGGATGPHTVVLKEISSLLNHSDAVKGRVYGQVNYELDYETAIGAPGEH